MPVKLISKIKNIFNKNKVKTINRENSFSMDNKSLKDKINKCYSEKENLNNNNTVKKNNKENITEFYGSFPDYSHLKKSLLGKDNYLFLVNDVNNELKQHFDKDYKNKFNSKKFRESYNSKKEYCEALGIQYQFFLIPDKCLVCQKKLPFEPKFVKRNYDEVNDLFPDFIDILSEKYYYSLDSHLNFWGGRKLSFGILRHFDSEFEWKTFKKLFKNQIHLKIKRRRGDLTLYPNLSYERKDLKIIRERSQTFKNKFTEDIEDIPPQFAQTMKGMKFDRIGSPYLYLKDSVISLLQKLGFRKRDTRPTVYLKNPDSYTDKKVLIFRDSGATRVYPSLTMYFNETLLYWDHWNFNKDLIEWYNPDIILEIRTERFIDLPDFEVV